MISNTESRYGRIHFFTARIHHTEYVSSGSEQNFNEVRVEVAAGPRRDRNKVSAAQLRRSIDYNLARAGRMRTICRLGLDFKILIPLARRVVCGTVDI